jgi:hypothetical protein
MSEVGQKRRGRSKPLALTNVARFIARKRMLPTRARIATSASRTFRMPSAPLVTRTVGIALVPLGAGPAHVVVLGSIAGAESSRKLAPQRRDQHQPARHRPGPEPWAPGEFCRNALGHGKPQSFAVRRIATDRSSAHGGISRTTTACALGPHRAAYSYRCVDFEPTGCSRGPLVAVAPVHGASLRAPRVASRACRHSIGARRRSNTLWQRRLINCKIGGQWCNFGHLATRHGQN